MKLPERDQLEGIVAAALAEDGADNDATVRVLGIGDRILSARLVAGERGVMAGIDVVELVFTKRDGRIRFGREVDDGARFRTGDVLAHVVGPGGSVLSAERVALNFLQRLSGIATLTASFVAAVAGSGVDIMDTRKTTPLLRKFERYAVTVGGGRNHRFNLEDMVLVKENHIRALEDIADLRRRLEADTGLAAEVEVDSISTLKRLLGARIDRIMLDNFTPDEVTRAVEEIRRYQRDEDSGFRPEIEVSGGVRLDNVRDFAVEGVDCISIGALTHSARALDISLEVDVDAS